jgi:hypothetical protein
MMNISKNAFNSRQMRSARLMKILAHLINNKGEIGPGHSEILLTTNKSAITCSLLR